jgi:molybdopterin molybdotransferase
MDGWALRAADTPGSLKIVGECAAGHGYAAALKAGEAVRIFTGAAVPQGADTVVIQEDAVREGDAVRVPAAPVGDNIRGRGKDFAEGARLLEAGMRLDPWRLALAASAGRPSLQVSTRPRVALLSTGEEVIEPGGTPGPFQIFNSGNASLGALCRSWGAELVALPIVGDDEAAIAEAARGAACDVIVTIGGASVGDHDLVKPALSRLGMRMVVESIAIRPGKPTWFAVLEDGRRVVGLPGNPASAMVCAELFLKPFLMRMQGADTSVTVVSAKAASPVGANGNREHWMRAQLSHAPDGSLTAQPLSDQDSSLVTVFASANALLRRRAGAAAASVGEPVDVLPLARA